MITKITNNDLSEAKEKELAVLDFSAAWCGPCKMLAPVLEHLADDMPNVSFYSIDVDENFPLSRAGGAEARPGGRPLRWLRTPARHSGLPGKAPVKLAVLSLCACSKAYIHKVLRAAPPKAVLPRILSMAHFCL